MKVVFCALLCLQVFCLRPLALPLDSRCFTDGVVSMNKNMDHGIAEICIKDDISIIKTTSTQIRNTSKHANVVYRKMLIQNYEQCNPEEVANGPIMIFKPNEDMMLIPHTFACRVPCTISLDEEEANIILHSEKLNHYEVMGTTTANRWFQGTTSYSLEHTCEHIQVTCGPTSLSFHACFKYHMACIRFLNRNYMPTFMVQSVCQNKELIIMGCLVLIIFGILYIMTMTYICYILIPIFYPITYLYGIIYNKSCKKCQYCGLAYHPFSKCGKNCVCGCMFENSDRMKKHRESGMCHGYKSLRAARILCKNRGSSFVLAVILSFLLLSFVQPIEGIKLQYNGEIIELNAVSEEFTKIQIQLESAQMMPIVISSLISSLMIALVLLMVFRKKIDSMLFRRTVYSCPECNMNHPKKGLVFFGDFTNRCNSCMCGCDYNQEMNNTENDYMIPMDHTKSINCYIPGRFYVARRVEATTLRVCLVLLTIMLCVSVAYADDQCSKLSGSPSVTNPVECSVWYRLPTSCSGTTNLKEFFRSAKASEIDIAAAEKMSIGLDNLLMESEQSQYPRKSYVLESGALVLFCNELADAKKKTGKLNIAIGKLIEKKPLGICASGKANELCKCFKGETGCDSSNAMTNAITYYKTHQQIYKDDLTKITNALMKTYPGLLSKELGLSLKSDNFSKVKDLAGKMKGKFGSAEAAAACITFLDKTLGDAALEKLNPHIQLARTAVPFAKIETSVFQSLTSNTEPVKVCKTPKIYRCSYVLAPRFKYFVTCNSEANKFYEVPETGFSYKPNESGSLCVADPFCDATFKPVSDSEKAELETLVCNQQDTTNFNFSILNPITRCHKVSSQTCTYGTANKTFVECKTGYFYEYTELFQSGTDDIGVYCFSQDCRTIARPHHVSNLQGCILHVSNLESRKLKEIVYENIEQLKHSIQEAIKTDLIEHKYSLTMNLPKMSPSFKALSIMGTETDSGVESAYIETNILARAGMSTGIALKDKKGNSLFDLVLFVRSAHYESATEFLYTTGPTVGINLQHDEQCTGSCPSDLKKPGWLSFYKEHTSTWGCEEFGCLAINEGCVFGHCRDIIKPEMNVYKKVGNDIPKLTLCITMPDNSYCHELDSFNPVITDKIEIQFLSNEAGRIPKIFGYKSNKVMTGMINDKGTFSKMCGSVQSWGKEVWGAGNVRFDFICHAARRKDVTVSRCFDNFYESCLNLNPEKDLIFDDKLGTIQSLNQLMGEIRIKIKLGDIRYKLFEKEPSMDVKASCVGCTSCTKGVDCELTIISSSDTICPIRSNCILYHNNIKIEANTQKYGLKAKCESTVVDLQVCSQSISAQLTLIDKHETIEVGNSDQTYYVKEKDLKCGTWLCKISDQGISSIFAPFFSIFGSYGKIAFYSVLGILCFALLVYLMLPICGRLKDVLKKNEAEYFRETYGYKPLSVRR
ncbi:polyprotein [Guama virus]|uniref:Envelopment polyprotein n=1 Tax=Guama virus TaxID=1678234 RepID=A0A0R7FN03_9VIRU|nr:polyprotein [Guama virus]AKO90175.1 polyprotein [Guama virus]